MWKHNCHPVFKFLYILWTIQYLLHHKTAFYFVHETVFYCILYCSRNTSLYTIVKLLNCNCLINFLTHLLSTLSAISKAGLWTSILVSLHSILCVKDFIKCMYTICENDPKCEIKIYQIISLVENKTKNKTKRIKHELRVLFLRFNSSDFISNLQECW